jgi:Secretion system C-terminal sorting domain
MYKYISFLVLFFSLTIFGQQITLSINGLGNLGTNFRYEGWIIVNSMPVTTGKFDVDDSGNLSQTTFPVDSMDLSAATKFVLTIEPNPDPDPAPSGTHILGGNFNSNTADLSVGDPAALGDDFMSAMGYYILATPTDNDTTDERSGLWFINPPNAGLTVPTLPSGWSYEGWAVIDMMPVTTGKFTMVDEADSSAPYSGSNPGPPFPGEDFVMNAPPGLTFPTDLRSGKAVVTIEPDPDNSTSPFFLKPLVAQIPDTAVDHTPYMMMNNSSTFPAGTAVRNLVSAVNDLNNSPHDFTLFQNYPNPFNPTTTIKYSIPKEGKVTLKVYDAIGNEVATLVNGNKPAGVYNVAFNAANLSSGVYFYRLTAGSYSSIKKLVLLK